MAFIVDEYVYDGLSMRVKSVKSLQNRAYGYKSYAQGAGSKQPFSVRETSYVTDYLSGTNNELMAYEKGFGEIRTVFGHGYGRLSRKLTPEPGKMGMEGGKSFFQSDLYASPLFASDEQGNLQRYVKRNAWGEPRLPLEGDRNAPGLEESLRFTSYSYDPVIGKYFAQERFYDAGEGRMLGRDPVKRGLNGYVYCNDDPVNYVDPTGEIANILLGGGIGGLIGGAAGFIGSAVSQRQNGGRFDARKAWGSAANGAVVGAVRGALVGSGVGLIGSAAADFMAGAAGNALEQKISGGRVDLRESMIGGLTNAVNGAVYGNQPLQSAKGAFGRGFTAGGLTSGINYLTHMGRAGETEGTGKAGGKGRRISGYAIPGVHDPKGFCEVRSPLEVGNLYRQSQGYHYQSAGEGSARKGGFNLKDCILEMLTGAVVGGVASTAFYKAGKVVKALEGSLRNAGNKPRVVEKEDGKPLLDYDLQFFGRNSNNKIKPNSNANGPHSVYKTDPITGKVTNYKTYSPNPLNPSGFDEVIGYDGIGTPHTNKVTMKPLMPHVHDKTALGGVRSPFSWEIPK